MTVESLLRTQNSELRTQNNSPLELVELAVFFLNIS